MIAQNSEVYNPPTYLFSLYTYMEKDLCRGVVYFTVLCDHPCLVSLVFAVLVSLHPVTFSNVFYYLYNCNHIIYYTYIHLLPHISVQCFPPNFHSYCSLRPRVLENVHLLCGCNRIRQEFTFGCKHDCLKYERFGFI